MLMSKALHRSPGAKNFSPQAKRLGLKRGQAAPRIGRNCLVLIAGRAPDEPTRPAFAFMVLKRASNT